MNQRCAVIATDAVGAAAGGLVRDGATGLVVPAGDRAAPSPPRSGACTTIRPCASASPRQGLGPWRRTPTRRGPPVSRPPSTARPPRRAASVKCTLRQGNRLCACPMRRLVTATLLLLLLLPAAHAVAGDNASDLLVDACRDEKVDGTYSQRTYKKRARPAAGRQRPVHRVPRRHQPRPARRPEQPPPVEQRRRPDGGGGTGGGGSSSSGGGGSGAGARARAGAAAPRAAAPDRARRPPRPRPPSSRPCRRPSRAAPTRCASAGSSSSPGAVGSLASDDRKLPTSILALLDRRWPSARSAPAEPSAGTVSSLAASLDPRGVTRRIALPRVAAATPRDDRASARSSRPIALEGAGGLQLGPLTSVEIALEILAGVAGVAALLLAPARRLHGGIPLVLFAILLAFTAASIIWAVDPDDAWVEVNRTLAWFAAFALGLVARARRAAALGLAARRRRPRRGDRLRLRRPDEGLPRRARTRTRSTPACASRSATGTPSGSSPRWPCPACLWLGARRSGHAALNALAYPALALLVVGAAARLLARLGARHGASAARCGSCSSRCACAASPSWRPAGLAGIVVGLWAFGQDALSQDRVPPRPARRRRARPRDPRRDDAPGPADRGPRGELLARRACARHDRSGAASGRSRWSRSRSSRSPSAGVLATSPQGLTGSISKGFNDLTNPNAAVPVQRPDAPHRDRQRPRALLGRGAAHLARARGRRRRRGRLPHRAPAHPPGHAQRPPRPRLRRADDGRPRARRARDQPRAVRRVARGRGAHHGPAPGRRAARRRTRPSASGCSASPRSSSSSACTPSSTGRGSSPATPCPRCCAPAGSPAAGR